MADQGHSPKKTGVLMLRERGSKKVPVSHIKVSHHLSSSTRRTFLARPAFLQDMQRMTDDAIKSYIIQHPPIVYQAKGSKVDEQLLCLGNLHALYMAKKRFRASEKIRVTLVETPLSKQVDALAISLALSAEACHALSPKESGHYILALWEELDSSQPQELLKLSENFNSKAALCDAFDLNRRVY